MGANGVVREEVVAMVIPSYALCFSLGACIGFAVAGFFVVGRTRMTHLALVA